MDRVEPRGCCGAARTAVGEQRGTPPCIRTHSEGENGSGAPRGARAPARRATVAATSCVSMGWGEPAMPACLTALPCGFILIWAAECLQAPSPLSCVPAALHSPLLCCARPQAAPGLIAAPISSVARQGSGLHWGRGWGRTARRLLGQAEPLASGAPGPTPPCGDPPGSWRGVGEQQSMLHGQLGLGTGSCWAQLHRLMLGLWHGGGCPRVPGLAALPGEGG